LFLLGFMPLVRSIFENKRPLMLIELLLENKETLIIPRNFYWRTKNPKLFTTRGFYMI